jgi:hypothetical protein
VRTGKYSWLKEGLSFDKTIMSKVWFELSKKDSELCFVLLISVNAGDNFCTTDAIFGKLLDNKNMLRGKHFLKMLRQLPIIKLNPSSAKYLQKHHFLPRIFGHQFSDF